MVIGPPGEEEAGAESLDESLRTALKAMSVKDAAASVAAGNRAAEKAGL